uniref:hypothetical protein n=1 Tax=unclassified Variovorax TaxID=663243 RepID=UPI000D446C67
MGFFELLGAMGLTGLASIPLAAFLADRLLSNRLAQELAAHTARLNTAVNSAKAEVEARYRQEVELRLGDAAADRTYRVDARRRLYQALGPLRFQLMVAAAEWANRVARFGSKDTSTYDMQIEGHFFRSTAYRLLRLLAIAELIERQIAYADFAVDPDMRILLKFKRQLGQCLSSAEVSLGHEQEDWRIQRQHVFSDMLSSVTAAMVVFDGTQKVERVVRFDEFQVILDNPSLVKGLHPIPALMTSFTIGSKPVLWLRMLAIAQLCIGLLEKHGQDLGLELQLIEIERMLLLPDDKTINHQKSKYLAALLHFRSVLGQPN